MCPRNNYPFKDEIAPAHWGAVTRRRVREYDQEMPQSHTHTRKIQRTITATRHAVHNKRKTTVTLFPSEMIAKLEPPQTKVATTSDE